MNRKKIMILKLDRLRLMILIKENLLISEGISGQLAATVKLCRISDSHKFTGQLAKAVHLWAAMYLFIGCSSITIIDSIVRAAYGTTGSSIFIDEIDASENNYFPFFSIT